MICLSCGECCNSFYPVSKTDTRTERGPCQHLESRRNDIYVCGIYPNRPSQCAAHRYHAPVCPIGLSVLEISEGDTQGIKTRLELVQEVAQADAPLGTYFGQCMGCGGRTILRDHTCSPQCTEDVKRSLGVLG